MITSNTENVAIHDARTTQTAQQVFGELDLGVFFVITDDLCIKTGDEEHYNFSENDFEEDVDCDMVVIPVKVKIDVLREL
jgi:hypothetical protein